MLPPTHSLLPPAEPEAWRYFIMATTSLPAGTAFVTDASQQHLLTQFALGFLSIADVVECLGTDQPGSVPAGPCPPEG